MTSLCVPYRGKSIALNIVNGLMALHEHYNVAHLDLKSPNILLKEDGCHACVADFGLGRVIGRHARTPINVPGTFHWAAPEQLMVAALSTCLRSAMHSCAVPPSNFVSLKLTIIHGCTMSP